ncbi:LamG-like jellyroll fold domain-containing protein [Massilia antarctica]|uniref:LamG-like jellyroll fold domain-containing protein n=1 Tax=Massilia antarctica TaxID=2765360 RepID=UPI001E411A79|nr:LamG-like jellyroll fold domain-containing protein [Massilia antarctica]
MAALGPLSLTACGGGADRAASPERTSASEAKQSAAIAGATSRFVHPGLLHTAADFERMRIKVAQGAEPWASGWRALLASGRSQLGVMPSPLQTVIRGGDGENFRQMYTDIARAYQLALRWKVSGDKAYADQALAFLNAWSSTMTTLTGNGDRFLAAGIYGYQWANAAEIMRTYSGWAAPDLARFQTMMLTLFYPLNHEFLATHNGSHVTHHWANWDLCSLASMLAIGVLCERADIYDEAMVYYKAGPGNGASSQAVYYLHPGHLGQWQESARDQGHSTLGIGLAGVFCEMAWNQGDDMYGYDNNRFLAGAEYVAKSNLKDAAGAFYNVPFATYRNLRNDVPVFASGGQGHRRPVWELVHHHYVNRKGLAAPYCALQTQQIGPEGDAGNGDQLGFGTLTFSRDPVKPGAAPSGLNAIGSGGQIVLSWWGSAGAASYTVKRASVRGGPYTTIQSGIIDLLSYTDSDLATGVYYYVVAAQGPAGESAASGEATGYAGVHPHTRLSLNQTTGTTATDSSGNGRNASLVNGPAWVAGRNGARALAFDGVDDYLSLPQDALADLSDFTIGAWVYWNGGRNWARIFDFGSGSMHYMMLSPCGADGLPRFAVTTNHGVGEQAVAGTVALPAGQWVHVALTLAGSTGTLYVNGAAAGSNPDIRHAPFRLGSTGRNWIGRSQYAGDPYFHGQIADFCIYRGALDASGVAALMHGQLGNAGAGEPQSATGAQQVSTYCAR